MQRVYFFCLFLYRIPRQRQIEKMSYYNMYIQYLQSHFPTMLQNEKGAQTFAQIQDCSNFALPPCCCCWCILVSICCGIFNNSALRCDTFAVKSTNCRQQCHPISHHRAHATRTTQPPPPFSQHPFGSDSKILTTCAL